VPSAAVDGEQAAHRAADRCPAGEHGVPAGHDDGVVVVPEQQRGVAVGRPDRDGVGAAAGRDGRGAGVRAVDDDPVVAGAERDPELLEAGVGDAARHGATAEDAVGAHAEPGEAGGGDAQVLAGDGAVVAHHQLVDLRRLVDEEVQALPRDDEADPGRHDVERRAEGERQRAVPVVAHGGDEAEGVDLLAVDRRQQQLDGADRRARAAGRAASSAGR
jgi:hypothetical protein